MTDETQNPAPAPDAAPQTDGSATADAWNDVVARMGELGSALSAWAKSAADDPANKQRLNQVRAGVDEMARQADAALGKVTSSDFGQQVTQGAQQAGDAIGDAAQQVSAAAAPHVATALSGLASVFGKAAAKVDEAVSRDRAPEPPAEASQPAPAGPAEAAPAPPQQGSDDQS
jgi:hypothetical protein